MLEIGLERLAPGGRVAMPGTQGSMPHGLGPRFRVYGFRVCGGFWAYMAC